MGAGCCTVTNKPISKKTGRLMKTQENPDKQGLMKFMNTTVSANDSMKAFRN